MLSKTLATENGVLALRQIALIVTVLAFPLNVDCQEALPPIVGDGFELLISTGSDPAIDHWAASWTSDDDLLKKAQLKNAFRPILEKIGHPEGYEIVEVDWIGSRVVEVFAVTFHPKQPLFFHLRVYHSSSGWMVAHINAHTSMTEVFPDRVMRGKSTGRDRIHARPETDECPPEAIRGR